MPDNLISPEEMLEQGHKLLESMVDALPFSLSIIMKVGVLCPSCKQRDDCMQKKNLDIIWSGVEKGAFISQMESVKREMRDGIVVPMDVNENKES